MNSAKIIADNFRSEPMLLHTAIREMNLLSMRLLEYLDADCRGADTDINYKDAVIAATAKAMRSIEIMTCKLDIRAEAHNRAEKSMEKSARKILARLEEQGEA